ncbi:hypothetical protein KC887_10390 [Candidatus Kaiserbacteria bacterium]|nr:hypothetical protein [Candidatus Kaiserbacteria bacterium]
MSNKSSSSSSSGIGFFGLLGVAFIVLKLIGYIEWSWVWVLAPLWMPITIVVFIGLVLFVIYLINN